MARFRILTEALNGGPDTVPVMTKSLRSAAAQGVATILDYQLVGDTRYPDAAGFQGRTVGLGE